jgi:Holliday junction resolvase RusA-like endonuclease
MAGEHYTDWQRTAGWELKAQSPTRISGSAVITIAAGLPDRRRRDADTLPKAILDLLVAHQVIEDDAKSVDVRTRWDENVPPGRIVISVVSETRRACLLWIWPE